MDISQAMYLRSLCWAGLEYYVLDPDQLAIFNRHMAETRKMAQLAWEHFRAMERWRGEVPPAPFYKARHLAITKARELVREMRIQRKQIQFIGIDYCPGPSFSVLMDQYQKTIADMCRVDLYPDA